MEIKVAITYSKRQPVADAVCDAFATGVEAHGDAAYKIKNKKDLNRRNFDVVTQYSQWNGGKNKVRGAAHSYAENKDKRKIILDLGLMLTDRATANTNFDRYTYVGYDHFKGRANCYSDNSPNDRWKILEKKGAKIKPWRTQGKNIVVFGQRSDAASTKHCNYADWLLNTLLEIRKHTDRPIIFRSHPITRPEDIPCAGFKPYPLKIDNFIVSSFSTMSIAKVLEDAWCSVTRTSNAGVDSILEGVPLITPDPICVGYDLASHSVKDIVKPATPDRQQFFHDLAYAQWSIPEITQGLAWEHLRPHWNKHEK